MNYKVLLLSLISLLSAPLTAHAYLVPLLGGAGAVASLIIVALVAVFIFGFFIWYHVRRIYRRFKPAEELSDKRVVKNDKYEKSPSLLARLIFNHRGFWVYLAGKESGFLAKRLAKESVKEPIYVMGLARSGTTILLEILSNSGDLAVQKYRDFPFIFTPYFWNKTLNLLDKIFKGGKKKERSHKDGLLVNSKSPEAMEEPIWMSFFENLHQNNQVELLSGKTENKDFENFYNNHLKKIILSQHKKRYLSKGNYNVSRIDYIQKIYPDAKIIIMIRNPINHVFSIIKQHRLFKAEQEKNPKTLTYMNMLGHFEFGKNFIPINLDQQKQEVILSLLETGDEVRAISIYWSIIYDFVKAKLEEKNKNIILVRYEDLCANSENVLEEVIFHAGLDSSLLEQDLSAIKEPSYYKIDFSDEELEIIKSETKKVAKYFDYSF